MVTTGYSPDLLSDHDHRILGPSTANVIAIRIDGTQEPKLGRRWLVVRHDQRTRL